MRKLIFILIIIFNSCQTEILPPETGSNNETDTIDRNNLLAKVVSVSDEGDSSIFIYEYDDNHRIMSRKIQFATHTSVGYYYEEYQHYYRDEAGRITKITGIVNNKDSSFTEIKYEGATTRITEVSNSNEHFMYDSLNRISKIVHYRSASNQDDSLQTDFYTTFFYNEKGNLIQKNDYNDTDNNGVLEPNLSYQFIYDDKINPLSSHDDIFIVMDLNWMIYSVNNVVKWSDVWLNRPTDVITYNFVYKEDGRPISCKHSFKDGETGGLSLIAEDFYFYQ